MEGSKWKPSEQEREVRSPEIIQGISETIFQGIDLQHPLRTSLPGAFSEMFALPHHP